MGSKRIGLARTQTLLQGLRRDLTMGGATFQNAIIQGPAQSASGAGMQSGSVTAPVLKVQNINGEILTTYQLDFQNLSGSADHAGDAASLPAYMFQWSNAVNGICYKIEASCIESPAGGTAARQFDLSSSTLATYVQGDVPSGDPTAICSFFGNKLTQYGTVTKTQLVSSPGDQEYIYLVCATGSGNGAAGNYTAGKAIYKFYGYLDFT